MASTINATTSGVTVTGSSSAGLNLLVSGSVAISIGTGATATITNATITSLTVSNPSTFPAGSASAPSITTTGDLNNGIFFPATDATAITTAGSERLRVDSAGNVGIGGTANANSKVEVLGTLPTSGNTTRGVNVSGTIPSGTTSNHISFYSIPTTQAASFTLGTLWHFYANNVTLGSGSAVTNNIGFEASALTTGTNIYGFYGNIAAASNRWNFYAAGTAVNYFAGDTRIGTTADLGQGARLNIESASGEADLITLRYNNAGAGKHWRIAIDSASTFLLLNQAGTPVGVQLTDGGNSWSSYSDERQKTNLKPIENAINKVKTLRAVTGRYTFDEETESRSFLIAQDVQKVLPEAVKQGADGNLLLAYQDVIPLLTKAIQELKAELDELKAKQNTG